MCFPFQVDFWKSPYKIFQVGLNCLFQEGHYNGIRAIYTHFGGLGNSFPSLPDGVKGNQKKVFTGYSIQLNYGIRF